MSIVTCEYCGRPNQSSDFECGRCGAPLPVVKGHSHLDLALKYMEWENILTYDEYLSVASGSSCKPYNDYGTVEDKITYGVSDNLKLPSNYDNYSWQSRFPEHLRRPCGRCGGPTHPNSPYTSNGRTYKTYDCLDKKCGFVTVETTENKRKSFFERFVDWTSKP